MAANPEVVASFRDYNRMFSHHPSDLGQVFQAMMMPFVSSDLLLMSGIAAFPSIQIIASLQQ